MPEIIIAGIPVNFPFPPYDVQIAYMEKVIMCLENCANGVLESPTGTGKTLSLLCATLAWLLFKKNQVAIYARDQNPKDVLDEKKSKALLTPKIIYASRTHSQLTQAMQELKNCSYSFMRAVVLGSRDQLCIHPEVMKENTNSGKVQLCKIKVTTRTCRFHRNIEKMKDRITEERVLDIEDLVMAGKKNVVCPYFMSRELLDTADIIFMPYNYLLDPKSSRSNNIDITNSIIILDEAHNIEKICEDSASIQIKSSDVASCISDVTHVMKVFTKSESDFDESDMPKDFTIDELALLKEIFLELEKAIDGIELTNTQADKNFPGGYMYDLLAKGTITTANYGSVAKLLDCLIQYIATLSQNSGFTPKGGSLQTFSDLLFILYAEGTSDYFEKINKCFKVHVQAEQSKTTHKDTGGWISSSKSPNAKIINLWCFNPGFGMNRILTKDVRSIILTSGTLSPLKPYIMELGIPVLHQLESPHIINESQVFVRVIPYGSDKGLLNCSYEHRTKTTYIASLGSTICSLAKSIPYGMLIFFPSYSVLLNCQENWQSSGIWNHISQIKPIYVEPRFKDAFLNTMQEYYEKINDPVLRGAIFMAVCRGKVSEGLDFADNNGRAVLITGIPFPPLMDPRVVLKKKYLQEIKSKDNNTLNPDEWYTLEASRAVNQAIGRVIRHKNDYGAILLCDARFNNPMFKQKLSKWLQGHLNKPQNTNFGSVIRDLTLFFRNAQRNLPLSVLKRDTKSDLDEVISNKSIMLNNVSDWNPVNQKSSMVFKPITSIPHSSNLSLTQIDLFQPSSSSAHSTSKRLTEEPDSLQNINLNKKKKYKLVMIPEIKDGDNKPVEPISLPTNRRDVLALAKDVIPKASYVELLHCLKIYLSDSNFSNFFSALAKIFDKGDIFYLLEAMNIFVKAEHKVSYATNFLQLSKIKAAEI